MSISGTHTYRKKAPSQVFRDTKRQQKRMKKAPMEVTQDSLNKNDGLNSDCNAVQNTGEMTQLQSLPLKTSETNVVCEIDNESDTSDEPEQSPKYSTQNKSGMATVDISHVNDTPVAVVALLPTDYKSASSLNDDTESVTSQDDVFNCNDFKCNICDKVLLSSWRRCTACNIFNICDTCYIRNEHSHHETQIHSFKQPNDLGNHCDSCGYEFVTRNAKYYRCNSCQDYVLCVKCKTEKMHERHSHQFEDKTMKK